MTWTYTGDPANVELDRVRFLCGDTDEQDPLLTDKEIEYLISEAESSKAAARKACLAILAKLSREVDYAIGPERVSANQRLLNYRRLMRDLGVDPDASTAAPSWDDPAMKGRGPIFDVGLHDFMKRGSGLDG